MEVRPSKQKELLQAIDGLTKAKKRSERGFLGARVKLDTGNSRNLVIVEAWETVEDVEAYLQSEYFNILRGGLQILTTGADIEYSVGEGHTVSQCLYPRSASEITVTNPSATIPDRHHSEDDGDISGGIVV
jgi:quinol monooxygenase YgiN